MSLGLSRKLEQEHHSCAYIYLYIYIHIYIYICIFTKLEQEHHSCAYIYFCKYIYIYMYIYKTWTAHKITRASAFPENLNKNIIQFDPAPRHQHGTEVRPKVRLHTYIHTYMYIRVHNVLLLACRRSHTYAYKHAYINNKVTYATQTYTHQ